METLPLQEREQGSSLPEDGVMKSTQDLIEEELLRLCQEEHFEACLLFNAEGVPMAGVDISAHYNADGIAALSVLLQQSADLTKEFNPDISVDEISLRLTDKYRIVSRPFQVDDLNLMLVAIVPQNAAYRKITTDVVQRMQQLF